MGNLNAFLNPVYREKRIEIKFDRFQNEDGSIEPIVMKSITQEKIQQIARDSTKEKKVNGKIIQDLDAIENMNRCLVESIVFPDLRNPDLCRSCGTMDPNEVPPRLFSVGEYSILSKTFAELNGIKLGSDGELEIPGEVTKN